MMTVLKDDGDGLEGVKGFTCVKGFTGVKGGPQNWVGKTSWRRSEEGEGKDSPGDEEGRQGRGWRE